MFGEHRQGSGCPSEPDVRCRLPGEGGWPPLVPPEALQTKLGLALGPRQPLHTVCSEPQWCQGREVARGLLPRLPRLLRVLSCDRSAHRDPVSQAFHHHPLGEVLLAHRGFQLGPGHTARAEGHPHLLPLGLVAVSWVPAWFSGPAWYSELDAQLPTRPWTYQSPAVHLPGSSGPRALSPPSLPSRLRQRRWLTPPTAPSPPQPPCPWGAAPPNPSSAPCSPSVWLQSGTGSNSSGCRHIVGVQ